MSKMGAKRSGEAIEAMKGLVKEGEQIMKAEGDPDVRDAGIIGARAARGTLRNGRIWDSTCACAKAGRRRAASVLQKTLNEEGEADHKLTSIAERHVNVAAAHG